MTLAAFYRSEPDAPDFRAGESKWILAADVDHTARRLEKIRLADVVSSFFAVDRAADKFSQVGIVSAAPQNSV